MIVLRVTMTRWLALSSFPCPKRKLVLTRLRKQGGSYNFSIKKVFLDHDGVHSPGVFEGEKAEAARATSGAISHYSAFVDFTKLREVVMERFCVGG